MLVLSLIVLACCLSSAASDSTLPPIVLLFDVVLFHCGFGPDVYLRLVLRLVFFDEFSRPTLLEDFHFLVAISPFFFLRLLSSSHLQSFFCEPIQFFSF